MALPCMKNFPFLCNQIEIKMKKYTILLLFTLLLSCSYAQEYAKYWVQFSDKNNTPFSVNRPEEFLSQRALQLRHKHRIPIDETDLPVNASYVQQVLDIDSTMRLCTKSKWLNGITVYCEREGVLDSILQLPFVRFAERTVTMSEPETRPDTPYVFSRDRREFARTYYAQDWDSGDFDYGLAGQQIRINNGHWLHRLGYCGESMRMMIMDGGFKNADTLSVFRNMQQDQRLLGACNLVQPEVSPFVKHTHGTSVLSCIAAYVPGKMVGTAPKVEVYLFKTEDARSENKVEEDNWVAGLELADSLGCQVLNSSLGYTKFDDSTQVRTYEDLNGHVSRASQAATMAAAKGMIVCNSAGNEGSQKWRYLGAPADARDILTVGAVDSKGKIASFSSHGPASDGRVKPDVCAVGSGCYVSSPSGFIHMSFGTSFSSPIMSGMVTCLWQAFPEKSNFEIMDAVRRSCDRYETPDTLYGYGLPDMLKAYNLLLQPDRDDLQAHFDSFVAENNVLNLKLGLPAFNGTLCPVEIRLVRRGKNKIWSQKVVLQSAQQWCTIKIPSISKKDKYGIYDLEIRVEGHETMHYVVAQ